MQQREPLLTELHFEEKVEINQEESTFYQTALLHPSPDMKVALGYSILFGLYYENLSLNYSRGYPVADLLPDLLAAIGALEEYRTFPEAEDFFFNGEQDEYMQALSLLALALLLHADTPVFERLVAAIGANGQDYLLEWLISRRLPGRTLLTKLLFPKTYARLRDAI